MGEIEKLLAGQPYNACDQEVRALAAAAEQACYELDLLAPSHPKRREILGELIGGWNPLVSIAHGFKCAFGKNIRFRGFAMLNYNCTLLDSNIITIGAMTLIGPGCSLICTNHALDRAERLKAVFHNEPISIGDYVWLGANVTVCPGVTIGDGAVIGAGSVVTHDVPTDTLAVGNPCRVIRRLSEQADEDMRRAEGSAGADPGCGRNLD